MKNFLKLIFISIILFAVNVNAQTSDKTTDEIKIDHDKTDDQESHQENNEAISIAVLPEAYQEKIQKLKKDYLNQKQTLIRNNEIKQQQLDHEYQLKLQKLELEHNVAKKRAALEVDTALERARIHFESKRNRLIFEAKKQQTSVPLKED
ncbi:MAG: hypothetical protein SVR94_01750 [Pseudomonadota bacterium]|nr:hypothetical protein [Pseudomonadota bacterium]